MAAVVVVAVAVVVISTSPQIVKSLPDNDPQVIKYFQISNQSNVSICIYSTFTVSDSENLILPLPYNSNLHTSASEGTLYR